MQTPGPAEYNQDDKAVKFARNSSVSIPIDLREKPIKHSPGPGHYETAELTSLQRKLYDKNRY